MPGNAKLSDLFDEVAGHCGREMVRMARGTPRDALAYASFGYGVQFALELAMLYPDLARQLIEQIHLEHPHSEHAWNKTAHLFHERLQQTGETR